LGFIVLGVWGVLCKVTISDLAEIWSLQWRGLQRAVCPVGKGM
jgi:hypothetical protein